MTRTPTHSASVEAVRIRRTFGSRTRPTLPRPSSLDAMARRMLLLAVVALACAPAVAAAAPRIVGGQPASHAYPYAAFVELHYPRSSDVGYCGGGPRPPPPPPTPGPRPQAAP